MQRVLVVEHYPMVPGYPEQYKMWTAEVSDKTSSSMCVRRADWLRWFRRYRWLPTNGMFIKIRELENKDEH